MYTYTHAYEAKNTYASANWKAESFDPLAMEIFSMVKNFRGEKSLLVFIFNKDFINQI